MHRGAAGHALRLAVALLLAVPQAWSAGGYPPSLYRLGKECASGIITDATGGAFAEEFERQSSAGNMLVDYEFNTKADGVAYISGIFQEGDGRGWWAGRGLSKEAFDTEDTARRGRGYRPIDVEVYREGPEWRWAGVWVENREGHAWAMLHDASREEYHTSLGRHRGGYAPVDVDIFEKDGGIRYNVVWVESPGGELEWAIHTDLTREGYNMQVGAHSDYWIVDFESAPSSGAQKYAVIFHKGGEDPGGRGSCRTDMSATDLDNELRRHEDMGYRPIDVSAYQHSSGTRYAVVWWENSRTLQGWPNRPAVDSICQGYMERNSNVVGMSVTVMEKGILRFTKGYGYMDQALGRHASSHTVYRLASVSKSVGAVLGYVLQGKGLIDLAEKASSYVRGLPESHTYTVDQTLTQRSGVRHYAREPGDPTHSPNPGQYDTAGDALALFIGDSLAFFPGSDCGYSTHAFTVTAAAYEGATGKAIKQLVQQYITEGLDVPTLTLETEAPNGMRSRIYDSDGDLIKESERDNLSWKVLGGGLESSSRDLARFFDRVIRGEAVGWDAMGSIFEVPDGHCGYNRGFWRKRIGARVCHVKGGAQAGSSSYVVMFPHNELTITVQMNGMVDLADAVAQDIAKTLVVGVCNASADS